MKMRLVSDDGPSFWLGADEFYLAHCPEVEISPEFARRYESVTAEYATLQAELGDMFRVARAAKAKVA